MVFLFVDDPPLEFNVFLDRVVNGDSEGRIGLGENLEILIFATFSDSKVDL